MLLTILIIAQNQELVLSLEMELRHSYGQGFYGMV
jgi:hypothetical protein